MLNAVYDLFSFYSAQLEDMGMQEARTSQMASPGAYVKVCESNLWTLVYRFMYLRRAQHPTVLSKNTISKTPLNEKQLKD